MNKIFLNKNIKNRIKNHYPWIFSNELKEIVNLEPGEVVEVISENGENYGYGFYNPKSLISIRLLFSFTEPTFDFLLSRIKDALNYRTNIMLNSNSYRLIYGESDNLPGLIVDKFDDYLSLQILSAGMERLKNVIVDSLVTILPSVKGIYEKNISHLRRLEGLDLVEGVIYGQILDNILISENNVKYSIQLNNSQKTGFYFDQKLNRAFIQQIACKKNVLDCYCNQGGFALNAALGGASYVRGIDSSNQAITISKANAILNNFVNAEFINSDVVAQLNKSIIDKDRWDIIILDPPAFAKSKKDVPAAIKAYRRINSLALKLLANKGILATSSCSQHILEEVFYNIICKEAEKNNKTLKLIYRGQQAPDHPILVSMPETKYLKFFIFSVF